MTEYKVYQVIYFRESLGIFVEHTDGGGGEMFSFYGAGKEPKCVIEDVGTSPFKHPKYSGCKLLGSIKKDEVDTAWKLCREYVEDEENKHEDITDWCVAAATLLTDKKLVVAKRWWLLPGDEEE